MRYYSYFHHGKQGEDGTWSLIDVENDLPALREKYANHNIHVTPQTYLESQISVVSMPNSVKYELVEAKGNSPYVSPLYFDLDHHENPDVARIDAAKVYDHLVNELYVPDHLIKLYFSGRKGFHIVIEYQHLRLSPRKDWHKVYKLFVDDLTRMLELTSLDRQVYAKLHMMRVPDSEHPATGLFKVELKRYELDKTMDEIRALAKTPRGPQKTPMEAATCDILRAMLESYVRQYAAMESNAQISSNPLLLEAIKKTTAPECIIDLLERGIWANGDRNQATMSLASYFKCAGKPKPQAIHDVVEWAKKLNQSYTSARGRALIDNTRSVVETVYENEDYVFKCPYILALGDKNNRIACAGRNCPLHDASLAKSSDAIEVTVAEAVKSEYIGKKLKTKVLISIVPNQPFIVPIKVRLGCAHNVECENHGCALKRGSAVERTLDASDRDTLRLCFSSDASKKSILGGHLNCPECKKYYYDIIDNKNIYDLTASTAIDSTNYFVEDDKTMKKDNRHNSLMVYFIADEMIDFNKKYIIEGYVHSSPKDNRSVLLVDKYEAEDSDLEKFVLTPALKKEFAKFRPKEMTVQGIKDKIDQINYIMSNSHLRLHGRNEVVYALLLCFHSVVRFKLFGGLVPKGWLDLLIIGDTGEGKSYATKKIMDFVGLGAYTSGESSGRTGITYAVEQANNKWYIKWGKYVQMDKQLLVIDEASALDARQLGEMTESRNSGKIVVDKIAVAEAYCRTRLVFLSNPRSNRTIKEMKVPIMAVADIFDSKADLRRIDLALVLGKYDVDANEMNSSFDECKDDFITKDTMRASVLWAWTREPSQVEITKEAEQSLFDVSIKLWDRFNHDSIDLISKGDTREKIARMAVALAAIIKSTDESMEKVIVTKEIVEVIYAMVVELYDMYGLHTASFKNREEGIELPKLPNETRKEYAIRRGQMAYSMLYSIAKKAIGSDAETVTMLLDSLFKLERYSINEFANFLCVERKDMSALFKALLHSGYIQLEKKSKDSYVATARLQSALNYMVNKDMGNIPAPPVQQQAALPEVTIA